MIPSDSDLYYLDYLAKAFTFPRTILQVPKQAWVVAKVGELPRGSKVLDAGCGAGLVSRPLLKDYRVTGIDNQSNAVEFCRRMAAEHGQTEKIFQPAYLKGDLLKLPFAENSFDAAIFLNVIEHLEDPRPMVRELTRVLKPGGRLLVTTENCDSRLWVLAENTWYRFFGGNCKPYLYHVHPQRFTFSSLRGCLQEFLQLQDHRLGVYGMESFTVAVKREGPMKKKKKVIVVMPAYNAAKTLERTYADIPKGVVDEVILVDDVSKDETVAVAKRLPIKVVVHMQNKGYGGNQKTCYTEALKAGADVIVMVHPDYQYDSSLIPQMISPILDGHADFVLGSRIIGEGALKGGMPWWRYVSNRFLTSLSNIVYNHKYSDLHTGFRAYSREMLETIPFLKNSDDFIFDGQFIAQAHAHGFRATEVPIPTRYFAEASSISFNASVRYGLATLKVNWDYFWYKLGVSKPDYLHATLEDVISEPYKKSLLRGTKGRARTRKVRA